MSPIVNGRLPPANPHDRPEKKVPLWAQLQHARHELRMIRDYDAAGKARPKARSSEGKLLAERQGATIATLRWLQSIDRDALRAFLDAREAAQPAEGGEA